MSRERESKWASGGMRRNSPSELCNRDRTREYCFTLRVSFRFVSHASFHRIPTKSHLVLANRVMVWLKQEYQAGVFRYLPASSDIFGYLQISAAISHPSKKILTSHMEYTESLPVPPDTHEAYRLPQSLAYKPRVSLTLAWPGRTVSPPATCERCTVKTQ